MSSSWNLKQGPNFVPAYQLSGTPFALTVATVGTTVVKITFPSVTRWVSISAKDATVKSLRIGFSENGVITSPTANYYLLHLSDDGTTSNFTGHTERLEVRCKEIYIRAEASDIDFVSVMAGLTPIESFPVLSASNGFKGVG
jgi:hypothetical protein